MEVDPNRQIRQGEFGEGLGAVVREAKRTADSHTPEGCPGAERKGGNLHRRVRCGIPHGAGEAVEEGAFLDAQLLPLRVGLEEGRETQVASSDVTLNGRYCT